MARVTVRDNAWVLSDSGDFSDPDWRRRLEARRARLRARLGEVRRPRRLQRAFVETMAFLYDRRLFDAAGGRWRIEEFLDRGEREFGGYDQVIIWQSYPRLGIDERNQFDYYRDMPGGYRAMRDWVRACHRRGVRALVGYNPWDLHTCEARFHLREVTELLAATGADGVYLDTLHAVPAGWPARLEKRLGRPVSFESEGTPAGRDIPGMDSSWGQGWPVHPPTQVFELRWLCPGNKVFLTHHRHRRAHWDEVRCALFTGTGVLVWENVFGNDTSWVARDKALLRAVKPIMREFWRNFASPDWQPLIPAARRGLAVNRWPGPGGTLYTLCWNAASPHRGPLFAAAVLFSGAAFALSWLRAATERSRKLHRGACFAAAVVLASVLTTPEGWWARIAPQTWLLPLVLVVSVLAGDGPRRPASVAAVVSVVLMAINVGGVGAVNLGHNFRLSRSVSRQLNALADDGRTVAVDFGWADSNRVRFTRWKIDLIEVDASQMSSPPSDTLPPFHVVKYWVEGSPPREDR